VASLVVLPDGRALAAGAAITDPTVPGFGVARYLASGALDTTFNGDGMFRLNCQSFGPGNGAATVLLQADGRLVLVGTCPPALFTVIRLNVDGSFDTSFGGGVVYTPFAPSGLAVAGLLQPDGRIVAVGYGPPAAGPVSLMASRYNTDGSLDASFGTGGKVTLPFAEEFVVRGAALQPDGRILIAGRYGLPTALDFGLVRLLPNGAPDLSFDGDGLARADFGGTEIAHSVMVLPDGRLVVAGSRDDVFAMVRFLSNGSLDATFGTGGLGTAPFGAPVTPDEALLLPNGNLMIAGSTNDSGAARDFLLARFLANGLHDTSFGTAGFLRTDFNASSDQARAITIAAPDRLLAGGISCLACVNCDFALARYIATTPVELLTFQVE
jgi:uncharacterized delta-60 repeat protein